MAKEKKNNLVYERRNIWEHSNKSFANRIHEFTEDYKEFINTAKTERESVEYVEARIKKMGFKSINKASYKPGERFYIKNEEKNIILVILGKEGIDQGFNLVASHIDCPRLDLKPMPLYEEHDIALLKTHYYGGIKKYQWLNIPLALHGTVVLGNGEKITVTIGEDEKDPLFVIPDLLPHLARKVQGEKNLFEAIEGESLNLLVGTIPVKDKEIKNRVKQMALEKLNESYGITEEDFISAEFEVVPAMPARDVGLDRSMLAAYGHDDRSCSYAAYRSIIDLEETPRKTALIYLVDKEEIGSVGTSSMKSSFFKDTLAAIFEMENKDFRESSLRRCINRSLCISGDVGSPVNPMYPGVHDLYNAAKMSYGVILEKYTGSGGKYHASDASAELMGKIRKIFNDNKIFWQPGSLGKIDQGGGGTVAMDIAEMGIPVVDCGPGVMGMHSPYEIISKADLYETYRAYNAFLKDA